MDWMTVLSDALLKLVVPTVATVAAAYVVKWLKAKGIEVAEGAAREQLRHIMETLVRWAEQRLRAHPGEVKKRAVEHRLELLGYDPNDPLVGAELEATVNRLYPNFDVAPDAEGEDDGDGD